MLVSSGDDTVVIVTARLELVASTDGATLDAALNRCDFALVVGDAQGRIALANGAVADRLGIPLDRIVGHMATEFAEPSDVVNLAISAISAGLAQGIRSKLVLRTAHGPLDGWMWTRAVELDGRIGGVSLVVAGDELERLGRDASDPWRELVPIAVGLADAEWNVIAVSSDIDKAIAIAPSNLIGRCLLDLVSDDDRETILKATLESGSVGSLNGVSFQSKGVPHRVCLIWSEREHAGSRGLVFGIVGELAGRLDLEDRIAELERRLRRIGSEVRAAGVVDELREFDFSRSPVFNELSARQWEILQAILRGERVPSIANRLYLSQSTVRNHLTSIFRKFNVHSQPELIEKIQQTG